MALKTVIDKLEDVPEAVRGEYTEKDGKFHLSLEGYEDPAKVQKALDVERVARAKIEKELKEQKKVWEKLGKTPDEIEKLVAEARNNEQAQLEKAGEFEKVKTQILEQAERDKKALQDKLASKDGEIHALKVSLQNQLVDVEATAAIASAKGEPILLLPAIQRRTKVVEEGGKHVVKVLDAKGDPMVDGKGNPLTIVDLVSELKQDKVFGRAFEASGNSGSGMRPNGGSGGSGSTIAKRSDLKTERERSAFINEYGLEAYQALPL
jgi:hypothetical protein